MRLAFVTRLCLKNSGSVLMTAFKFDFETNFNHLGTKTQILNNYIIFIVIIFIAFISDFLIS